MAKVQYTFWQKVWYYSRRLLRTAVPQLPALLAALQAAPLPPEWIPWLILAGALLTTLDKWIRDMGLYKNIPVVKSIA